MSQASQAPGLTNRDWARIRAFCEADVSDQKTREKYLTGRVGPKTIRCIGCHTTVQVRRNSRRRYCEDCSVPKAPHNVKRVWCISCGEAMDLDVDDGRGFCDGCFDNRGGENED